MKMRQYLSLVLLVSLLAAGCGDEAGTVTGTVSYDGKPLLRGQVTFLNEEAKKVSSSIIDKDGKYSLKIMPGKAKITVSVPGFRPLAGGTKEEMDPAKFGAKGTVLDTAKRDKEQVQIPSQYSNPKTTTLQATVAAGIQEHNIKIPKEIPKEEQ